MTLCMTANVTKTHEAADDANLLSSLSKARSAAFSGVCLAYRIVTAMDRGEWPRSAPTVVSGTPAWTRFTA